MYGYTAPSPTELLVTIFTDSRERFAVCREPSNLTTTGYFELGFMSSTCMDSIRRFIDAMPLCAPVMYSNPTFSAAQLMISLTAPSTRDRLLSVMSIAIRDSLKPPFASAAKRMCLEMVSDPYDLTRRMCLPLRSLLVTGRKLKYTESPPSTSKLVASLRSILATGSPGNVSFSIAGSKCSKSYTRWTVPCSDPLRSTHTASFFAS